MGPGDSNPFSSARIQSANEKAAFDGWATTSGTLVQSRVVAESCVHFCPKRLTDQHCDLYFVNCTDMAMPMTQERLDKVRQTKGATRTVPEALTRGIDVVLNISLLTVLLIHAAYRTGLFFANPLSDRLQGKHTFLWFLGTFVVWLAWKLSRARLSRSKPSA
jgi:hypothetical protein